MKKSLLLLMTLSMVIGAFAQNLTLKDIYIRDPFIMPVEEEGVYYMYATSPTTEDGQTYGGVKVYRSKDLKTWTGPVQVFDVPRDNFLTGTVWAPEVHPYNGKYYLFATMNSDIVWKAPKEGHPQYIHRATQIYWADSPEGPFHAFDNKLPHTPMGQMCLDGTLWVENGTPYMIYCHEWVEMIDGTMEMVELNGSYAIGIAESVTGRVFGPWRQQKEPLFEKDGGHGMIFKTFEGKLRLVLHSPNGGGLERAHLFEIEDCGDTLKLIGEVK